MIQKPNLLPPSYLPPPPVNWLRMGIIALSLTIIFAIGLSGAKFYLDIKNLENDIKNLTGSLNNLSPTQERIQDTLQMQKEVERLKALRGQAGQKEIAWSALLSDTARVMPSGLRFNEVSAEGEGVTIKGTAQSPLDVAQYVIELRKFKWFAEVEIKDIVYGDVGGAGANLDFYAFEIKASLPKEGGQENAKEPIQQKPSA